MTKLLTLLVIAFSFSAQASDHWDFCSSADGYTKMDYGTLYIDGVGEISENSVTVKVLQTVEEVQEKCTLKGSGDEILAYDNTVSVERVTYTVEENDEPTKVIVICERGGSGVPASDDCQ